MEDATLMLQIEFPNMRMNVLYSLNDLRDPDIQIRKWVKHEAYGSFDEVIHALFDDSCFERDPRRTLGTLLFEEGEADRIKDVIELIDRLFEKYGKELSDGEYMDKPEWPTIMASAQVAYDAMKQNDLRYMDPAQRAELYQRYKIRD
jgi:hypothetical protein